MHLQVFCAIHIVSNMWFNKIKIWGKKWSFNKIFKTTQKLVLGRETILFFWGEYISYPRPT
jgi:hypothetical protein